jgi:starch synthase
MRVLFVAAEVAPFAKAGGLADVALALPRALRTLGVEIVVVMPKYRVVADAALQADVARFSVPVGRGEKPCAVARGALPDSAVPIYFLGNREYYDRPAIYGEGSEYPDALERFTFLSRGALSLCEALGWTPDVIHVNDWHTALIPAFLGEVGTRFRGTRSLLTIHNLAYQGVFPSSQAPTTGLSEARLVPYRRDGTINLLRGGILTADLLNTVSPTYAREILDVGEGLEKELRARSSTLHGVLNGIDASVWDPATDSHLWARYSADDLAGKAKNKEMLQRELELDVAPRVPLIAIISRLVEQKGFDLIMPALDRMMSLGIQLVLLGTGAPGYEASFRQAADCYRGRLAALLTFSEPWAHCIEAAADLFLMPSRFEPCGLNQQYSLHYGTVPVVRATGGLRDTVADYDPKSESGNGFSFETYSLVEMIRVLTRAVELYRGDPVAWHGLQVRGMNQELSWTASAKVYLNLYRELVA